MDNEPNNAWTISTLRQHLTALIEANDRRYSLQFSLAEKAVAAALSSAEQAVLKAEDASEKRFEGVNEFRAALGDQQRSLMPRAEAEIQLKTIMEGLKIIEMRLTQLESQRHGAVQGYGWAVGILGILLSAAAIGSRFIK